MLKKRYDQNVEDLHLELLDGINKLTDNIESQKSAVEKKYKIILSRFLTSNLNKPTIYDSICSYILYFKSTLFEEHNEQSLHEEPQVITFKDITDIQYTEHIVSNNTPRVSNQQKTNSLKQEIPFAVQITNHDKSKLDDECKYDHKSLHVHTTAPTNIYTSPNIQSLTTPSAPPLYDSMAEIVL